MKAFSFSTVVFSILAINSAYAVDIPCKREGTIAAFRAVLDNKESQLSDMTGAEIREAGVYLDKKSGDKVTLTVNLGLTENGLQRSEIVKVELNETYDNACQVISAQIQAGE